MAKYEVINMENIDLIARRERAEFIATMFARLTNKLGKVFVSELRTSRVNTLARLQAA